MKRYFTISGPIGSGKSSISKTLAAALGAEWRGFGSTVREIAIERGLPTGRKDLQSLGANLIERECELFCRRIIAKEIKSDPKYVIIDGLRHRRVLDQLRALTGKDSLSCIFVETPTEVRLQRVKRRDGLDEAGLAEFEKHSTESEVQELKNICDFVADNSGSEEACVKSILEWIESNA